MSHEKSSPQPADSPRYRTGGGGGKGARSKANPDPARNAAERNERPSPDARKRGETSAADRA